MIFEDKFKNTHIEHTFMNWKFIYNDLKKVDVIKTYCESSHFERMLIRHKETGMLFLYEFYEYQDFVNGNDEIYETYAAVSNEEDADELNEQQVIRRTPYIFVDNNFNIRVKEQEG